MVIKNNSVIIEPTDNVAVAIEELTAGMKGTFLLWDGTVESVDIIENIPIYHKFATQDIPYETPVIKYGEHIGYAGADIKKGQHVHVHNLIGRREIL